MDMCRAYVTALASFVLPEEELGGVCCVSRRRSLSFRTSAAAGPEKPKDLFTALAEFRRQGAEIIDSTGGSDRSQQWSSVCDLVAALLLGPEQHIQQVQMAAEVTSVGKAKAYCKHGTPERVVTLTINVAPAPLIGEVATRSHLGCEIHLSSTVVFALMSPPTGSDEEPLVLEVEGFHFELLSCIEPLRRRIESELGTSYSPETVYQWWVDNIHDACPLQHSKLHRIVESLFGLRSFKMTVPQSTKVATVWAIVNAAPTRLTALEFMDEGVNGFRVSAVRLPPEKGTATLEMERCDKILRDTLVREERVGELFAPSSFNFMRFIHGHSIGQPGGSVEKLTKLFTAAHTWGPARDGWQQWDETWCIVDEKGAFNQVMKQNGRILWHRPRNGKSE